MYSVFDFSIYKCRNLVLLLTFLVFISCGGNNGVAFALDADAYCSGFRTPFDCINATNYDCGFCATSFNCLPRKGKYVAGKLPCSTDQCPGMNPFITDGNTEDAIEQNSNVVIPPKEWDLNCKNGGKRSWNLKDGIGNDKCVCPSTHSGLECAMCTSDASCGGKKRCDNARVFPLTNTSGAIMYGKCKAGDICNLVDSTLGVGDPKITVEINPMPGYEIYEEMKSIKVKIAVGVKVPTGGNNEFIAPGKAVIASPYLMKFETSQCKITRNAKCPSGIDFGWAGTFDAYRARCVNVDCYEQPKIESCPSAKPWYIGKVQDACSVVSLMLLGSVYEPTPGAPPVVQLSCVSPDLLNQPDSPATKLFEEKKTPAYRCSVNVNLGAGIGHGQIVIEASSGGCVDEIQPLTPAEPPTWCEVNLDVCHSVIYVTTIVVPVVPVVICFVFYFITSRRRQAYALEMMLDIQQNSEGTNLNLSAKDSGPVSSDSDGLELQEISCEQVSDPGWGKRSEEDSSKGERRAEEKAAFNTNETAKRISGASCLLGWDGEKWQGNTKLERGAQNMQSYLSSRESSTDNLLNDSSLKTDKKLKLSLHQVSLRVGSNATCNTCCSFFSRIRDNFLPQNLWYEPTKSITENTRNVKLPAYAGRSTILSDVSGTIKPGLTAVLGPSGCGKTTLIDIIAGRKSTGKVGGRLCLNGQPMTPSMLRSKVGYVLQDDILPGTATVHEYLMFHAFLRLPGHVTEAQRSNRVKAVLKELNLAAYASVRIGDAFTRGLSGGQKRRLSLSVELINSASGVILMDEPTSGLDSTSSKGVIDALGTVVSAGRIAIISIHQPPSVLFLQFDNIILLSPSGDTVYFGPTNEALPFLSQRPERYICPPGINPAEFLLDLVSLLPSPQVKDIAQAFTESDIYLENQDKTSSIDNKGSFERNGMLASSPLPSSWRQFNALAHRNVAELVRHPVLIAGNVIISAGIGILCGMFYAGLHSDVGLSGILNRAGVLSFILLYYLLNSLVCMGMWLEERLLYIREHRANCYSPGPYILAKMIFSILPVQLCSSLSLTLVAYFWVELNPLPMAFMRFVVILILSNLVGASMMILVGTLSRSTALAHMIGTVVLLFTFLFEGILVNQKHLKDAGIGWVAYFSYLHFSFESLVYNEMLGTAFTLCKGDICVGVSVDEIARDNLGFDIKEGVTIPRDIMALLGFFIIFNLGTYFLLKYWVKEKR